MGVARAKSRYTVAVIDKELSLQALVDASDDAIIGKTRDGTIVSWNKGAEKIYGYKPEEILGKSISTLIPPGRANEFPKIMRRLRRGGHFEKYETTRMHKDGHLIDVSVTISPVKSKNGMVVGACAVARDISDQKQAEHALRQSEERFRIALKSAPVVVFSQDLQLRYTWMNSPYLFSHEKDLLGRTDAEVFPGEDGARLTAIKEEVLRTGTDSHTEVTVTVKGVKHYFDLVVEPLRDPGGMLLGLLGSAVETSDLKETIVKLQNALNEVQVLRGLLPICARCKRIKDEHERWQVLEVYLQAHSEAKFTHGICPDCLRKLYPDQFKK
jgi:PAS domain S-box-containing protein